MSARTAGLWRWCWILLWAVSLGLLSWRALQVNGENRLLEAEARDLDRHIEEERVRRKAMEEEVRAVGQDPYRVEVLLREGAAVAEGEKIVVEK